MHIFQKSGVVAIMALMSSFAIAAPAPDTESTLTSITPPTATSGPGTHTAAPQSGRVTHPFTKRSDDKCWDGASFASSDFWAIENSFYSNYNWHWLDKSWCSWWTWGSVKVCACNLYLFETTSVYDRSIGDALSHIGNCCLTSVCSGGRSTITGDTGLYVDVSAIPNWQDC